MGFKLPNVGKKISDSWGQGPSAGGLTNELISLGQRFRAPNSASIGRNIETGLVGKHGFGEHLLDPRNQGGLLGLTSAEGQYGRLFGEDAKQRAFGDSLPFTDPGNFFQRENPADRGRREKEYKAAGQREAGIAAQNAAYGGVTGGTGNAMADAAYQQVMNMLMEHNARVKQQEQQRTMQGFQMLLSLIGMGSALKKPAEPTTGYEQYNSAQAPGSYGPSEYGE